MPPCTTSQGTGDNGNVTGYTFTDNQTSNFSHTATYCYDALNRLTQAIATGNSTYNLTFSYDQYGNMSCVTNGSTHGPCNNVTFNSANNHINTTGYAYDAAGNLTQDPTNSPTNTYQWDAEGRLRAIVQNGTTFLTNTYNSLGQLVEADYPGYNAKVLATFDAAGRELGQYNGVGGYWWDQDVWAGGRMLAQEETGVTYFLHANTIGSDTQVTNQAGTVLMDMLYYPWGQVWQTAGSTVDSHFAGFQKSAGPIYQTPNRSYLDTVARWLTPDPLGKKAASPGNPQSWNMFAFVLNNPTTNNDPSGEMCVLGLTILGSHFGGTCAAYLPPRSTPPVDSTGNPTFNTRPPGPPSIVRYNGHTVTDPKVNKALREISIFFASSTVSVTSGDRNFVPVGGARNSAHLTGQAADFHILGVTDSQADLTLKSVQSPVDIGFRLIQHGPDTITEGPHLHLDTRNGAGQPTIFMHEGMSPEQTGVYSNDPD
jgi:RHS repeat-associated protein